MDSLDLNVHSAILTSLAQCYATSSANDEPIAILAKLSALCLCDQTRKEVSVLRFDFMATPPRKLISSDDYSSMNPVTSLISLLKSPIQLHPHL